MSEKWLLCGTARAPQTGITMSSLRSFFPLLPMLGLAALLPLQGLAREAPERDGQHDFDFEIGTWKNVPLLMSASGST